MFESLRQHFFCFLLKQSLFIKAMRSCPASLLHPCYYWRLHSIFLSSLLSAIILENWHLLEHLPKGSGLSFSYFNFSYLQWPFALFDFVDLICHLCCWLLWLIQSAPPPVLLIHSTHCPAYLFSCLSTMILWPHQDVQSIYFPTSLLTSPCFISIPSRSHFIGLHFFEFIFYICIFIFN